MCFLGISTLLIILLTAFTRLPVCWLRVGSGGHEVVAEHLTDLLQIRSVYWFVLTWQPFYHRRGIHRHTRLNHSNALADARLRVHAYISVYGCACCARAGGRVEYSPGNSAKEEALQNDNVGVSEYVDVCLSSKISEQ